MSDAKSTIQFQNVDKATGEVTNVSVPFDLEPVLKRGKVPQRVIDELVSGKQAAVDFSQAFSEAVKEQAKKYEIKPGALRRYVTALVADKVEDLDAETDDLDRLLEE